MRYTPLFLLLCMIPALVSLGRPTVQGFDREAYYAVMATGNIEEINDELLMMRAASINEKEAFEGALLMRKAGLLKKPEEKLKAFKKGRIKLETALMDDRDNGEYRFLRVMIQEHAPHIVKYYKELNEDRKQIIAVFGSLSPVVQKAILSYAKTSKILRPDDF